MEPVDRVSEVPDVSSSAAEPTPAVTDAHRDIRITVRGEGEHRWWLFEPASPQPASAPVIVFNHGFGAADPAPYGGWIRHLVQRGNVVIYPKYQDHVLTPIRNFDANVARAVREALDELTADSTRVQPATDQLMVVGHSAGGVLAINYAAQAAERGLPEPVAVFCVQPGIDPVIPLTDLSKVSADTALVVLLGDLDGIVGRDTAYKMMARTSAIPQSRKRLWLATSDLTADPPIINGHTAPVAYDRDLSGSAIHARLHGKAAPWFSQLSPSWLEPDAVDQHLYWRMLDELQALSVRRRENPESGVWSLDSLSKPAGVEEPGVPRVVLKRLDHAASGE